MEVYLRKKMPHIQYTTHARPARPPPYAPPPTVTETGPHPAARRAQGSRRTEAASLFRERALGLDRESRRALPSVGAGFRRLGGNGGKFLRRR